MKRIAVIADSHFDESPGGRFLECVHVHGWIAKDLKARNVDLALHAGDVFERRSTAAERNAFRAWAQAVADVCPLVIVRGNHDRPGDLDIFGKLETKHPIIVEEAAGVHVVAGVVVGCLAWPSKASVLASIDGPVSHEEGEQVAGDALRNVLRGLDGEMSEAAIRDSDFAGLVMPRVLLAHAMVRNSRTSVGQPLVGCDLEVGLDDLRLANAGLYALGHIHMPQEWHGDGQGDVVYPGSPRRTAFGETEDKGYILAEFDEDAVTWERVATPCAPMLLLEAEWDGERFTGDTERDHAVTDADIRFRYSVDPDHRDVAAAAAAEYRDALLEDGAAMVKIDPVVNTTGAARAPEVAAALTLQDKLMALWAARDTTPNPERTARLLNLATELEHAS